MEDTWVEVLPKAKCIKYPRRIELAWRAFEEYSGLSREELSKKLNIKTPMQTYNVEPLTGCPAGKGYHANATGNAIK
jgi:hypothetical protein